MTSIGSVPNLTLIYTGWSFPRSGATPVEAGGDLSLQVFKGENDNKTISSSYQAEAWAIPALFPPKCPKCYLATDTNL